MFKPVLSPVHLHRQRPQPDGIDLNVMNADGSSAAPIPDTWDWSLQPLWSPDGNKIAFSSNRDGEFDVYVMNASSIDLPALTNGSLPGSPSIMPP